MTGIRTALLVLVTALALASPAAADDMESAPQRPAPATEVQPEATPAPSVNASETRQVIWQTQVGCVSRCTNTTQVQQASQSSSTSQSGAEQQVSHTEQEVHQTQIGCPAVCLGDDADVETVHQTVLAAIEQDPPSTAGGAAVVQVIRQVQIGCRDHCRGASQEQHASQESTIDQAGAGVASVLQFIWQLQIGCMLFCEDTAQIQAAIQVSHTIQGGAPPERAPPLPQPPSAPPPTDPPPPPQTIVAPETAAAPAAYVAPPATPRSPLALPPEPRSTAGASQPVSGHAAPRRSTSRRPLLRPAARRPRDAGAPALSAGAPPAGRRPHRSASSSSRALSAAPEAIGSGPPGVAANGSGPLSADLLALLALALAAAAITMARRWNST
jgi:hypothetical protein